METVAGALRAAALLAAFLALALLADVWRRLTRQTALPLDDRAA